MELFTVIPYNRANAVEYARKYALTRNARFEDYTGIGGDCTNFVSQAVFAGVCVMNMTPEYGWYYVSPTDRAPAWSSVEFFYDFITGAPAFADVNGGEGPFGREVLRRQAELGDVVQLADDSGDFYHTLIITDIKPDEIFVSAHTNDALDRPLSSYTFARARFIRIEGARVIAEYPCFEELREMNNE